MGCTKLDVFSDARPNASSTCLTQRYPRGRVFRADVCRVRSRDPAWRSLRRGPSGIVLQFVLATNATTAPPSTVNCGFDRPTSARRLRYQRDLAGAATERDRHVTYVLSNACTLSNTRKREPCDDTSSSWDIRASRRHVCDRHHFPTPRGSAIMEQRVRGIRRLVVTDYAVKTWKLALLACTTRAVSRVGTDRTSQASCGSVPRWTGSSTTLVIPLREHDRRRVTRSSAVGDERASEETPDARWMASNRRGLPETAATRSVGASRRKTAAPSKSTTRSGSADVCDYCGALNRTSPASLPHLRRFAAIGECDGQTVRKCRWKAKWLITNGVKAWPIVQQLTEPSRGRRQS